MPSGQAGNEGTTVLPVACMLVPQDYMPVIAIVQPAAAARETAVVPRCHLNVVAARLNVCSGCCRCGLRQPTTGVLSSGAGKRRWGMRSLKC